MNVDKTKKIVFSTIIIAILTYALIKIMDELDKTLITICFVALLAFTYHLIIFLFSDKEDFFKNKKLKSEVSKLESKLESLEAKNSDLKNKSETLETKLNKIKK